MSWVSFSALCSGDSPSPALALAAKFLFADILQADWHYILLALAGGPFFNVANLLLVAAIDIAGLAVAFQVGNGLALVVWAVSSYIIVPAGNSFASLQWCRVGRRVNRPVIGLGRRIRINAAPGDGWDPLRPLWWNAIVVALGKLLLRRANRGRPR